MAFGREPEKAPLYLTLEADFAQIILAPEGVTFPVGTTVKLRFYPPGSKNTAVNIAEWTATVLTSSVKFRVESGVADLIPDRAHYRLYVSYPDTPTLEHCWFVGDVARKQ